VPMTRVKPWPVVAGILVDVFGSVAVGVLYLLVIFGIQIIRGAPRQESLLTTHLLVLEVLGLLLTATGGFVAARLARISHTLHGVAVGVGALLVWQVVEWVSPPEGTTIGYEAVTFLGAIPAGALGGWLAGRTNQPLHPRENEASNEY
jgi:putative membrane protein (TIGR04086 family)